MKIVKGKVSENVQQERFEKKCNWKGFRKSVTGKVSEKKCSRKGFRKKV